MCGVAYGYASGVRSKEEIGQGLAERLRRAREHAGLSHARLAAACGLSEFQLIKLERGTGGGAGLWTIEALQEG